MLVQEVPLCRSSGPIRHYRAHSLVSFYQPHWLVVAQRHHPTGGRHWYWPMYFPNHLVLKTGVLGIMAPLVSHLSLKWEYDAHTQCPLSMSDGLLDLNESLLEAVVLQHLAIHIRVLRVQPGSMSPLQLKCSVLDHSEGQPLKRRISES